ncbi:hypothetical protein [Myxococcus landrumensis]|uniref:Uncharacterized protein n=1 Tax=Myxococcus landrumensis TaxID=2813577 RepID=A0ABX7N6C1_9BACT|nr:hypothetical protein [Myxococcus landrumus]QSQ14016.1 hypothetical protein JY572_37835 [Myxococcus landrumus]
MTTKKSAKDQLAPGQIRTGKHDLRVLIGHQDADGWWSYWSWRMGSWQARRARKDGHLLKTHPHVESERNCIPTQQTDHDWKALHEESNARSSKVVEERSALAKMLCALWTAPRRPLKDEVELRVPVETWEQIEPLLRKVGVIR